MLVQQANDMTKLMQNYTVFVIGNSVRIPIKPTQVHRRFAGVDAGVLISHEGPRTPVGIEGNTNLRCAFLLERERDVGILRPLGDGTVDFVFHSGQNRRVTGMVNKSIG